MASGPITSWQIDGEAMETVRDFIFLGSKITVDCDCSPIIKRQLHLGSKGMTNLDSILKSRDITLPTTVHLFKGMVFPVVMYGCESWTIKKAEHWRIDAFELWCWRRLLRALWTPRRSKQSILNEICPEYALERLILKLKLRYFGHLRRADSLEKTLMLGKIECRRGRGWQRMSWLGWHHWLDGQDFEQVQWVGDGQGSLVCCSPWGCTESNMTVWPNWTQLKALVECIHACLFTYDVGLLSDYTAELNSLTETFWHSNQKYLLAGSFLKKLGNPWYNWKHKTSMIADFSREKPATWPLEPIKL